MDILILGFSRLAQGKLIPAFITSANAGSVEVASRRTIDASVGTAKAVSKFYSSYEDALKNSKAQLVYVSTENSTHEHWVEQVLNAGKHVIVDKPSFLNFEVADRLVQLAQRKGLCLAEATVYAFHPQIDFIRSHFSKHGAEAKRINVSFSIPPLPADNFRYRVELGGGCLFDMGPYAVSIGRVFFGDEPTEVHAFYNATKPEIGVDISFSVIMKYANGAAMAGHFGFDTEYRNLCQIFGPGMALTVDRIFTSPPDLRNEIPVQAKDQREILTAPAGNAFQCFFEQVIESIKTGRFQQFYDALVADARTLSRVRKAAMAGQKQG